MEFSPGNNKEDPNSFRGKVAANLQAAEEALKSYRDSGREMDLSNAHDDLNTALVFARQIPEQEGGELVEDIISKKKNVARELAWVIKDRITFVENPINKEIAERAIDSKLFLEYAEESGQPFEWFGFSDEQVRLLKRLVKSHNLMFDRSRKLPGNTETKNPRERLLEKLKGLFFKK